MMEVGVGWGWTASAWGQLGGCSVTAGSLHGSPSVLYHYLPLQPLAFSLSPNSESWTDRSELTYDQTPVTT